MTKKANEESTEPTEPTEGSVDDIPDTPPEGDQTDEADQPDVPVDDGSEATGAASESKSVESGEADDSGVSYRPLPVPPKMVRKTTDELEAEIRGWSQVELPEDHGLARDELEQYVAILWEHATRSATPPPFDGDWLIDYRIWCEENAPVAESEE